jgi:hypothetical protein
MLRGLLRGLLRGMLRGLLRMLLRGKYKPTCFALYVQKLKCGVRMKTLS